MVVVRQPSTGEIIATSANQIVPLKFRGPTKILYYIHQTPLSSCSVEVGSGAETRSLHATFIDTSTLLRIYLTCICPHLEYACQLWDPYTDKGTQALESVQKFACKVCLKRWDMDYESMLQQLELTSLSQRRNFLKLTTMYNIINGTLYFPTGYFVQNYFPYSSSHGTLNYIRPFARTNYLYSSFVPSVISLWNNLPDSVKTSSISVFKAHIPH